MRDTVEKEIVKIFEEDEDNAELSDLVDKISEYLLAHVSVSDWLSGTTWGV